MANRTCRCLLLFALAEVLAGCDGANLGSPLTPSPGEPRPTYALSGVVSEVTSDGLVPVEGARVETCDSTSSGCASHMFLTATTDRNGSYRVPGLSLGEQRDIGVSKEGFEASSHRVPINGETRFDVQLVRR